MLKTFQEELAVIKTEIPESKVFQSLVKIKENKDGRPFVLYGAGMLGRTILDLCRALSIEVACFCDRMATDDIEGVEIITPSVLNTKYPDAVILICSHTFNSDISANLQQMGFSQEQIIQCPCEYPYFTSLCKFEKHLTGYEWAYRFFQDDRSKQLVLDRIRLMLCDQPLIPNTACECYYEDDFITLADREIFVDAGAYIGDTAEAFAQKMEEAKKEYHVYSFEPDSENYNYMVGFLSANPNITVVQKGLWHSDKELIFTHHAGDAAGSSFVILPGERTGENVPVVSLDRYFSNKAVEDWPTFVKMDIEGAEKEALLGSAEIIKRNKPKLAICSYHKPEDIYCIAQTITGIRDDYRFALRQHCDGCWDTVLYAV